MVFIFLKAKGKKIAQKPFLTHKALNIYSMDLYRKSLPTPTLGLYNGSSVSLMPTCYTLLEILRKAQLL